MICTICQAPSEGDLCTACASKTTRLRPANRFVVDRAAKKTRRLVQRAPTDLDTQALNESFVAVCGMGRKW